MSEAESLVEYGWKRAVITITAILCALLEIIDTTIVNVALNDMQGNLGATMSELGWVITAYAIANVIIVPMTSWLSQQFGRRNYFAASILIFTISSFLCGNANGIWELVLFRFIQGLGGGALLVTAQTIITETFPTEKRGMAQAIYGMGVIVGPTLGPPLGGYFIDNYSWPYIFYINIPVGIAAFFLTLQFVKSPKYGSKRTAKEIDWLGIIFLILAVGSLQYVLEKGQEEDWFANGSIIFFSITAFLGAYLFIWRELTYEFPIVNLRVLKNKNLSVGAILTFVLGFGLFGSTFIIPLYTQSIMGWTATQAGLLLIPSSLTTGLMLPIIGRLLQRGVSQKYLVAGGFTIFFLYSLWAHNLLTPSTGEEHFFWLLIVRGLGLGLLFVPITTLSLSSLKPQEIGDGAAFTGMMRQLGGSFGIALITTYISRQNQVHRSDLVSHLSTIKLNVQERITALTHSFMSKGFSFDRAREQALKMIDLSVNKQATVLSYMDVFLGIGLVFLICVPFVLMIKKGAGKVNASAAAH
ncbi:DHA2 family efflux MFS transporter permease subunit [Robertkochia solimangrovi]|uniref:DHA2 family efflux MFS transporter permease subunit n=1 Tax=Robertkochia solimangrovi TaxID=2213046 RepID=UPI00117D753D|nr:DHA2 family efflux MFS transporter permease subunit [Robertkochia solimangrovi]TRZ45892.1 MFS transporter [Robertkochia solimangrovi]